MCCSRHNNCTDEKHHIGSEKRPLSTDLFGDYSPWLAFVAGYEYIQTY